MKIQIPVECHNGHKANWYFEINGLVVTTIGVPYDEKCDCPKGDFGFGYQAVGPPLMVPGGLGVSAKKKILSNL